jgi:hypothetical protein
VYLFAYKCKYLYLHEVHAHHQWDVSCTPRNI